MLPLDLPACQNHPAMQMRTHKENGVLYGSIFNLLRWAGLDDAYHSDWHHWVKANFQEFCRLADSQGDVILQLNITLPGESNPTPMTNFAGLCRLITLFLHKSKILQAFADSLISFQSDFA